MNSENRDAAANYEQLRSRIPPITGMQAASLIVLCSEMLIYSQINSEEARLLISMDSEFKDEFAACMQRFLRRIRLDIIEHVTLPRTNEEMSLQALCEACHLITKKPVQGGQFSDPTTHVPGGEYCVAVFQQDTDKLMLSHLLETHGYRPATLRETLLILQRNPHILNRHSVLRVFGSGSSYQANLIPEIRLGRNGERNLKFKQSTSVQSNAYHSILAKK